MNDNLPYMFNYTMGSLWGSGHGKKDTFTFQSNYPVKHIVETTLKIKEVFNFNFHDIASSYGEYKLQEDIIKIFKANNIECYYDADDSEDYYSYLDQEALLYYWEKLLLIIDPTIILKLTTIEDVSYKIDKCPGYGLYD